MSTVAGGHRAHDGDTYAGDGGSAEHVDSVGDVVAIAAEQAPRHSLSRRTSPSRGVFAMSSDLGNVPDGFTICASSEHPPAKRSLTGSDLKNV